MGWTLPVNGGYVTSGFGPRNVSVGSDYHYGVDIGGRGTDWIVRSVGDGVVLARGYNAYRGNWIAVRHDDDTTATYQHLASFRASKGQRVAGGTELGVMGNTASALKIAIHLHLEWFPVGKFLLNADAFTSTNRAVDPEPALRARGVDLRTGLIANPTPLPTLPDVPILTQPIIKEILMAGAQLSDFIGLIRCKTGAVVAINKATGRVKPVTHGAFETIVNSGLVGSLYLDDGAGHDMENMDEGPFNALIGLFS